MSLLRSCGRLVRAFGRLPVACHTAERIRSVARTSRVRGYVTVASRPGCAATSNEKSEEPPSGYGSNGDDATEPFAGALGDGNYELHTQFRSLWFGLANGRIQSDEIARVLEGITEAKDERALALLRLCGNNFPRFNPADRRILAGHVWKFVARDPSTLTLKHYHTLLDICSQNRQPVEPWQFLKEMSVEPDETTHKLLLRNAATCGNVESAMYVLAAMKEKGYSLTEETLNLMIMAHGNNKDVDSALSTLETMKSMRIRPTAETYANVAYAYATSGDFENTMKILNSHRLDGDHIMEIVRRLSGADLGCHIPEVLKFMMLPVNYMQESFVNSTRELTYNGRAEDAYAVIDCLIPANVGDTMHPVFVTFLKDMVRAKTPTKTVLRIMDAIMTTKNYPLAITDVCEGALQSQERDLALLILEEMHERGVKVRPHYYWPLLIEASRTGDELEVVRTLRHMLCLNVAVDYSTLTKYLLPHIDSVNVLVTIRKLEDLGLDTSVTYTPIVCFLLKQGRTKEAVALCARFKGQLDFDYVLPIVIKNYWHNRNIDSCVPIFKYAPRGKNYPERFLLQLFGETPSGRVVAVVNDFIRAFRDLGIAVSKFEAAETRQADDDAGVDKSVAGGEFALVNPLVSLTSSRNIPHPRDMSIEQLECHYIELKAKGLNMRGLLRRMLQLYCRNRKFREAEAIKSEYDEKGYLWTPGMYSNLMQLYMAFNRTDEALSLHKKLLECKDFKVDDFKIIQLAKCLVTADRASEAFELLERTPSHGRADMSRDCWRLLTAMAKRSSHESTEAMLETLVRKGYCEITNTLLGPLVQAHVLRDDLPSAVRTMAKCAERYGHTPWRQELVYALVKKINSDGESKKESIKLLEEVQRIETRLRGSTGNKMDMLVALARLGMIDELRKFVQQNRIDESLLERNLTYIPKTEIPGILTALLAVTENRSGISRSFIYEQLLAVHSRRQECEQALELWEKWSAEKTPVSRKFTIALESLLNSHNVPLPADFPKRRTDE